ncbi:ABC transporter ATP-binding protein [Archaeoglobales archaeon]|nr:MAG: ABC transporter ATP-binding protein [Archaeoglobales archaeon]
MQLLEVRNLSKTYDGVVALRNINLVIEKSEVVGIYGPNGSGKSTLLKIVSGFEKPTCGTVIFEGRDITNEKPYKIARMGILYSFQIPRLFTNLSVLDNLSLGLIRELGKFKAYEESLKILSELDLENLASKKAGELSQGEMKLLEVLKVLISKPKLLLLDEPFASLDSENVKKMLKILLKQRYTMVITAHRMKILKRIASRCLEIREGKIAKYEKIR